MTLTTPFSFDLPPFHATDLFDDDPSRSPVDVEIVVPTLNEEERLPTTLDAILDECERMESGHGWTSRVVVVDNGSSDRTSEVADAVGRRFPGRVVVIGCTTGGKGAAVRRGIMTSRSAHVGFLDADLAVPAHVLPVAMHRLIGGADVVIASRRCVGATYAVRQSRVRQTGGWLFRRAVRDLVPGVADTQCGFKFFAAGAAHAVFDDLTTHGFSFDVEILSKAHSLGYGIEEVPVVWSDGAASSLNPITHGGQILRDVVRLRRLHGAPVVHTGGRNVA